VSTVVKSAEDIHALVGQDLGTSSSIEIGQERIDAFADVTEDHQWIHTDPVRAAAGPFGTTIAHGYLTLSLLIPLLEEILVVENRQSSINYGLDKVRFPSPVPVGSRIRMSATLTEAACVATAVLRHIFRDD
jgi:acyl dehydratase